MKKTRLVLVSLWLALTVAAIPVSAAGIDMTYEGELDIQSGDPVKEDEDTVKNRVSIGDGAVYDKAARQYIYTVGRGEVAMNLPSGVITTSKVSVTVPDGMAYRLFCDGKEAVSPDLSAIRQPGSYVLRFGEDDNASLRFTVVGALTGLISGYQLPSGFHVTQATRDGQELSDATSYVDMSEEGQYVIRYLCSKAGATHTLEVTVDHTPPALKLEAVKDGYASGPVSIADVEKDAKISLTLNGNPISYTKELTRSGAYRIDLTDKAGNTTTYSFVIRVYFNFNSIAFIVLLLGVIAAVGFYIFRSCRNLRIR